jgi:hypothetical protein
MEDNMDLFVDMTITLKRLTAMFNCNDGQLEAYDLDWAYFHKLARRSQAYCDKQGIKFEDNN